MHVVYRRYKADHHEPILIGVITSNVKAIKYVEDRNKEEKADGGWWEWTSVETKAIKV